jgi:transglutaminase-like putative cysteine protease
VKLKALAPAEYLTGDDVIDLSHPSIKGLAGSLRAENGDDTSFATAAFEYARDVVRHSVDVQDPRVTLSASETLREGVGLCFAKAHLLTALLRTEGIPTGLCYQRLAGDGSTFYIHGLVAVHLQGSWHRQDPRGNKPGVDAQFSLTTEQLAWPVATELGEHDYPQLLVSPYPDVVESLRGATDALALCRGGLPSQLEPEFAGQKEGWPVHRSVTGQRSPYEWRFRSTSHGSQRLANVG